MPAEVDASVAFEVPPDVRLRAFVHGPRVGIGPRIERIAPERPATASTEVRLDRTWSRLAGGGRVTGPTNPRRRRRRDDDWASIRAYLDGLVSQHETPVMRSTRPVPAAPVPVSRSSIQRDLCRTEVGHQPWWNLPVWLRAWGRAGGHVDAEVARREAEPRDAAAAGQDAADRWWDRLVANDPDVLIGHLDRAFAEHATPAAVVTVDGSRAHVVVSALTVEKLIGTREPKATDDGGSRLGRLDKERRHALYEATLHSTLLSVAAEVFALAPSLATLSMAVVAPAFLGGPAVLMLAELPRDLVLPDGAGRADDVDLVAAAASGEARLVRDKGGRLGALRAIEAGEGAIPALLAAIELA